MLNPPSLFARERKKWSNKGMTFIFRRDGVVVMKNCNLLKVLSLAVLVSMVAPSQAFAAAAADLGQVIQNTSGAFENFPNLLSLIAYLSGLFLSVAGLFKFKDHVDNPNQNPLSAGVKRFLAGGMFLTLPYMLTAMRGTLMGTSGPAVINNTGYTSAVLTPGGLDEMIVNLMTNISGPLEGLLTAFTYIAGIALLLVGISRLTKRMDDGPRGPAGMGTIMTFIASGALFSFGDMMGVFTTSIFGDRSIMTQASITSTTIDAADAARIQTVIEAVMVFVMLVGYIAFIRGWFVLKAFADGQQGATMAQGLTFLFGGAMAINLGELINALQASLGITGVLTFG